MRSRQLQFGATVLLILGGGAFLLLKRHFVSDIGNRVDTSSVGSVGTVLSAPAMTAAAKPTHATSGPSTRSDFVAFQIEVIQDMVRQGDLDTADQWSQQLKKTRPTSQVVQLAQMVHRAAILAKASKRVEYADLSGDAQLQITLLNKKAAALTPISDATSRQAAMDLLTKLKQFNVENPDYLHGWILQAQLALMLDRPIEGQYAAEQLVRLGVDQSTSPTVQSLVAELQKRGWYPSASPSASPSTRAGG